MHRRAFLLSTAGAAALVGVPLGAMASTAGPSSVSAQVDTAGHRVHVLEHGVRIRSFGRRGAAAGELEHPAAAVVDALGQVWVADRGNHRVQVFDTAGAVVAVITDAAGARLTGVRGMVVDAGGRVLVADPGNHRVLRFDDVHTAVALGQAAVLGDVAGLNYPTGLALDARGRVHVADTGHGRVAVLDAEGVVVASYGQGVLTTPTDVQLTGWRQASVGDAGRRHSLTTA